MINMKYFVLDKLLVRSIQHVVFMVICLGLLEGSNFLTKLGKVKTFIPILLMSVFGNIIISYCEIYLGITFSVIIAPIFICLFFYSVFDYRLNQVFIAIYLCVFISIASYIIIYPIANMSVIRNIRIFNTNEVHVFSANVVQLILFGLTYKINNTYLLSLQCENTLTKVYDKSDYKLLIFTVILCSFILFNYLSFIVKLYLYNDKLLQASYIISSPLIFIETVLCVIFMMILCLKTKYYNRYKSLLNNPQSLIHNIINESSFDEIYDYIAVTETFLEYIRYEDILKLLEMMSSDFSSVTYKLDDSIKHSKVNLKHIHEFLEIFIMDIALQISYEEIIVEIYYSNDKIKALYNIKINDIEKKRLLKRIDKNLDIENLKYAIINEHNTYKITTSKTNVYFLITLADSPAINIP